jgi:hypothetical protein
VKRQGGIKVDGFYSDLLYQPWFCSSVEIPPEWLQVDNIDRFTPTPASALFEHHVAVPAVPERTCTPRCCSGAACLLRALQPSAGKPLAPCRNPAVCMQAA